MNIWQPTANMLGNGRKSMPGENRKNSGCDVLITGRYFCDVIITGLEEVPRLGYEVWGRALQNTSGRSGHPGCCAAPVGAA